MSRETPQLHMLFFPFLARSHIIPLADMAKLFRQRGVRTTIVTTHANIPLVSNSIQRSKNLGDQIDVKIIKFPTTEVGLPEGFENIEAIVNLDEASIGMTANKFNQATAMLQEPLELLMSECKPDCLVADTFFPWATDAAAKFGIPSLLFYVSSFFSSCTGASLALYEPHKKVSSDSEPFLVPNLPGDIKLTRSQLPHYVIHDAESEFAKVFKEVLEADLKSYGVIFNSFYELEPAYADHYRKVLGRRAWHIGPVSLCNSNLEDKVWRGKQASIDEEKCLEWLNSKKQNSVVYVSFGTLANFSSLQLMEIAMGLEASRQQFIWVVKKGINNGHEEEEDCLPEGFEKRIERKGLIIRGWAPQLLILEHEAVGGFVTQCGWNSILEGVAAGVPMLTWPISSEQFYNEKLVTQVLEIGVSIGVQQWSWSSGDFVKRETIEKAVKEIIIGDKAPEMRKRAKVLEEMARRAVEEGGSSSSDIDALIEELKFHPPMKQIKEHIVLD